LGSLINLFNFGQFLGCKDKNLDLQAEQTNLTRDSKLYDLQKKAENTCLELLFRDAGVLEGF
jgi:hypothetical protein